MVVEGQNTTGRVENVKIVRRMTVFLDVIFHQTHHQKGFFQQQICPHADAARQMGAVGIDFLPYCSITISTFVSCGATGYGQ
jgi:hypothetical protein